MRRIILAGAVLALAACGGSNPATVRVATSPSATSSSSDASSSVNTGTTDGSLMTCSTVVDSGPPSVTAKQVISGIQGIDSSSISAGTLSTTDMAVLETAALDLENYQGDHLAGDAEQYAQDEQSYSNNGGSVDTSYASALESDIRTLAGDCP